MLCILYIYTNYDLDYCQNNIHKLQKLQFIIITDFENIANNVKEKSSY